MEYLRKTGKKRRGETGVGGGEGMEGIEGGEGGNKRRCRQEFYRQPLKYILSSRGQLR